MSEPKRKLKNQNFLEMFVKILASTLEFLPSRYFGSFFMAEDVPGLPSRDLVVGELEREDLFDFGARAMAWWTSGCRGPSFL